jgi:hypothetical protein
MEQILENGIIKLLLLRVYERSERR